VDLPENVLLRKAGLLFHLPCYCSSLAIFSKVGLSLTDLLTKVHCSRYKAFYCFQANGQLETLDSYVLPEINGYSKDFANKVDSQVLGLNKIEGGFCRIVHVKII
jgi:hypothetical protein